MNKKIGVLTFHQALSYGAKLQAYALQTFLTQNGIENEIVDYKCDYMYNHYIRAIRLGKNKIKSFLYSLSTMYQFNLEKKQSVIFRQKYMKLSIPYTSKNIKDAKYCYKAFITGSDQVWSPTCVGFDPTYFLNFANSNQKYSYAASIAKTTLPENKKADYKKYLSDFQQISVREESAKSIIKDLTGKNAIVNIDPTLLLLPSQWNKIAFTNINEPYIFLFNVQKPKKLIEYAKNLSKKTGLKIYYLSKQRFKKVRGVNYLNPVLANEFVGLIKNAEYICTNSFHATVFSIIYKKNFIVETEYIGGKNIRSAELLKSLGIKNHILEDNNCSISNENIDWSYVDKMLQNYRNNSIKYINSIKNQINKNKEV